MKKPIEILMGNTREQRLEDALRVAMKSLRTYGKHPIIERLCNEALKPNTDMEIDPLYQDIREILARHHDSVHHNNEAAKEIWLHLNKKTPITEQHLKERLFKHWDGVYFYSIIKGRGVNSLTLESVNHNGIFDVILHPHYVRFQYIEDVDRLIELLKK